MNNPNTTTEQKGLSLKYFRELVEKTPSAEEIKKELGGWSEEYEIKVPQTLQKEDKDKLKDYEELEVKDLPKDWRAELARIKELEKNQVDYLQKKEELKGWTDTFEEKKPLEVQTEIKDLGEKLKKTEEELNARILELETDLKTVKQEKETILTDFKQKELELTEEIRKWQGNFNGLELEEVKNEWEEMKKRPDIPISEKEFYDNFARRETLKESQLVQEKLIETEKKVIEYRNKNSKLLSVLNQYLKNERIRRYAQSNPVLTIKDAREAIADLLEQTENNWEDYFQGIITDQNYSLNLTLWQKDEETRTRNILEWIKEARVTLDYERLFERWSDKKVSEEWTKEVEDRDLDGTLYLLWKWSQVKDFEVKLAEKAPETS